MNVKLQGVGQIRVRCTVQRSEFGFHLALGLLRGECALLVSFGGAHLLMCRQAIGDLF